MVINLIFDKPDICAHEGFGHSVSLDHSLCNTHSHRYFLSLSLFLFHCFLPLTQLSRTSLTSDPVPLGTVIDFSSDPLNLGWRRVRTGELVAIVRYSGGDAEDEGERSMCADGWACISRNNSQPWRKSRGLEARCVSNTDAGVRADGGGWRIISDAWEFARTTKPGDMWETDLYQLATKSESGCFINPRGNDKSSSLKLTEHLQPTSVNGWHFLCSHTNNLVVTLSHFRLKFPLAANLCSFDFMQLTVLCKSWPTLHFFIFCFWGQCEIMHAGSWCFVYAWNCCIPLKVAWCVGYVYRTILNVQII